MTTYYATKSPALGNGLTPSTAFLISNFWSVAVPGDTLVLTGVNPATDGHYTGSSSMIVPPGGLTGTPGNPITIVAANDGGVELDGQNARQSIRLASGCNYFVISGIDCHSSGTSGAPVSISGAHNTLQRIVAWDGDMNLNEHIFSLSGLVAYDENNGSDNLLEDCGAFGLARKCYETYQGRRNVFRRCWGDWQGNLSTGPKKVLQTSYHSDFNTAENCLMMWSAACMTGTNYLVQDGNGGGPFIGGSCYAGTVQGDGSCLMTYPKQNNPYGCFGGGQYTAGVDPIDINLFWYGNLTIYRAGIDNVGQQISVGTQAGAFYHDIGGNCAAKDIFIYAPNVVEVNNNANARGYRLSKFDAAAPCTLDGVTTIIPGNNFNGSSGSSQWTITNAVNAVSLAAGGLGTSGPETLYDGSLGAKIKYRYVNGVLTGVLLWPWPMSSRILAATTRASTDGHGHPIYDLDSIVQSTFGTYPAPIPNGVWFSGS